MCRRGLFICEIPSATTIGLSEESNVTDRVHYHPGLIFAVGTQVVVLRDVLGDAGKILHPRGAAGVVVKSPEDLQHAYRVRFPDDVEVALSAQDLDILARYQEGEIGDSEISVQKND